MLCFFASDLHGRSGRYAALFAALRSEPPGALFLGGDLLPTAYGESQGGFLEGSFRPGFARLREALGDEYPRVILIPGNDDARVETEALSTSAEGLWEWAHARRLELGAHPVLGYACVPPTPFRLKDWERYDVSRFVDPGCVSPEEGVRSAPPEADPRHATIAGDLAALAGDAPLADAILLTHSPPYRTALDRAALDGRSVDHAPLDVHVGSIAIRRFIEERQPLLSLHGHVHESARLTGSWRDRIGRTHCFGGAHDGPELALVRFDPERLDAAERLLL
jgi:Icc-related predicted phosphoesterase